MNLLMRIAIILLLWTAGYHIGLSIKDPTPVIGEY